jgi:hypothetical protein
VRCLFSQSPFFTRAEGITAVMSSSGRNKDKPSGGKEKEGGKEKKWKTPHLGTLGFTHSFKHKGKWVTLPVDEGEEGTLEKLPCQGST